MGISAERNSSAAGGAQSDSDTMKNPPAPPVGSSALLGITVPYARKHKFNRLKFLICRVVGHKTVPVEMDEEACRIACLKRDFGDLVECTRCHGRTTYYDA